MKAYVIRPTMNVFDGTGALSERASAALDLIATLVTEVLREGGDFSHHALLWDGPSDIDIPPTIIPLPDQGSFLAVAQRFLDPNNPSGGEIRSKTNCRAATFGQDGQAILCLRHEDAAPVSSDVTLAVVTEELVWIAETDVFDGPWPPTKCVGQ